MEKNDLINEKQFGFRKGLSTTDAIIEYCETLLDSLDKNKHSVGVFHDLSKAFDSVDHQILLHKVDRYGIRGKALELITSYLQNRWQLTEISAITNNN